jgi:hypothetical protein
MLGEESTTKFPDGSGRSALNQKPEGVTMNRTGITGSILRTTTKVLEAANLGGFFHFMGPSPAPS